MNNSQTVLLTNPLGERKGVEVQLEAGEVKTLSFDASTREFAIILGVRMKRE